MFSYHDVMICCLIGLRYKKSYFGRIKKEVLINIKGLKSLKKLKKAI